MANKPGTEIWVYGDLRDERLFGFSLNVLAKARELARTLSAKVAIVLMGSSKGHEPKDPTGPNTRLSMDTATGKSITYGADFVYVVDHEGLVVARADSYAKLLADAVSEHCPRLVMFPLTEFGRELAARTARINHAGLIAECVDLCLKEDTVVARCPSWGGEIMAHITFSDKSETGFLTVQPHALQAVEVRGQPGAVEWIKVDHLEMPQRLKLLSSSKEHGEKQKLEEADVVVVGGAGLGNMDHFGLVRELAAAVGGEVGATRPPVLLHWVDEERLIGQTGKTVRPDLLFSIGTSGAVQYTAGIMESKTIVAINRDKNAPIFEVADIGIVADAKTFLPILTAKIRQTAMRKLADIFYGDDRDRTRDGFGARVHKLRESHDLSLEALANATGQSPEFIEKVENDELSPSVSFLLRLASTLKVDPSTFLSRAEKSMIRNMRAQAQMRRTHDYSYQTLSPGTESDHLRAFMITIEPKQTHKPVAYKHEGEEFIYVIEGDLRLTLGSKTHDLKPGESIHFNSDTPHKLKSTSNEITRCLVVLYTP